ncbi:MAG: hypothetical protein M0D55_16085 [Elusimicrobiota bacterium]|nr:MAG: hypothetical protein M0D55_16085 [Elusimicrobiota bacterium]
MNPLISLDESTKLVADIYSVIKGAATRRDGIARAARDLSDLESKHGLKILSNQSVDKFSHNNEECADIARREFYPFLKESSFIVGGLELGQQLAVRFRNGELCRWTARGWGELMAGFANETGWKVQEMRAWVRGVNPGKADSELRLDWHYVDFYMRIEEIIAHHREWHDLIGETLRKKWSDGA